VVLAYAPSSGTIDVLSPQEHIRAEVDREADDSCAVWLSLPVVGMA